MTCDMKACDMKGCDKEGTLSVRLELNALDNGRVCNLVMLAGYFCPMHMALIQKNICDQIPGNIALSMLDKLAENGFMPVGSVAISIVPSQFTPNQQDLDRAAKYNLN